MTPQDVPKTSTRRPKRLPIHPKTQDTSESPQDALKRFPRHPMTPLGRLQDGPKCPPDAPKAFQDRLLSILRGRETSSRAFKVAPRMLNRIPHVSAGASGRLRERSKRLRDEVKTTIDVTAGMLAILMSGGWAWEVNVGPMKFQGLVNHQLEEVWAW